MTLFLLLLLLSLAPALLILCALRPSAKRWRRFPINQPIQFLDGRMQKAGRRPRPADPISAHPAGQVTSAPEGRASNAGDRAPSRIYLRTPLFGGPTIPSSEISSSSRGRLAVLFK